MNKNILRYENFLMESHFNYIDSLLINESFSDITSYLRKVFKRIKNLSVERKKTLIIYALTGLMAFSNSDKIFSVLNSDDYIKAEIAAVPGLKEDIKEKIKESPFKDATTMKLSQNGWNQIKSEEGDPKKPGEPVLKAYKLGDGKITVGWGHAESIGSSKYKVGQVITKEEAQNLLEQDLKVAADGVRRIFKEWKEKGIERKITQDQFDALVSMAFNMGVGGLRRSEVIQQIKKGNYKKAGESIKEQNVIKKFGGLKKRRERESNLFLSYLEDGIEPENYES